MKSKLLLVAMLGVLTAPLAAQAPVVMIGAPSQSPVKSTINPFAVTFTLANHAAALTPPDTLGATGAAMDSIIVAAKQIQNIGYSLRVRASGHVTNDSTTKHVRIQFAGVTLDSMAITASAANLWVFDCAITTRATASGTQAVSCLHFQGTGTPTSGVGLVATLSYDPTIANVLRTTARAKTAGVVTQDQLIVEFVPTP